MRNSAEFAQRATETADFLEENGWTQDARYWQGKGYCAVGAYCQTQLGNYDSTIGLQENSSHAQFFDEISVLVPEPHQHIGLASGITTMVSYNDGEETTREDIINLFRDAAVKFMPDDYTISGDCE